MKDLSDFGQCVFCHWIIHKEQKHWRHFNDFFNERIDMLENL